MGRFHLFGLSITSFWKLFLWEFEELNSQTVCTPVPYPNFKPNGKQRNPNNGEKMSYLLQINILMNEMIAINFCELIV